MRKFRRVIHLFRDFEILWNNLDRRSSQSQRLRQVS